MQRSESCQTLAKLTLCFKPTKMLSRVKTLTQNGHSRPSLCAYRYFCSISKLDSKTALITGSTSGIGLNIAESLASEGCKVVLTGFGDKDNALNTVKASAKDPNSIHFIDADLCKREDAKNLVNESIDCLGSLDIVINNAGVQIVSPIESFDEDKYEMMINVMLNAPFYISKTAIPNMRKNGYGRIINIASAHGLRSSPFKAPYCSAKHG